MIVGIFQHVIPRPGDRTAAASAHVTWQTPQIVTTSTEHVTARRGTKASTVRTTSMNVQPTQHRAAATQTALTRSDRTAVFVKRDGQGRAATVIRTSTNVYFRRLFVGHMERVLTSRGSITALVIGVGVAPIVTTVTASLTEPFVRRIISVLMERTVRHVSVCPDMTSSVQVWHGNHFEMFWLRFIRSVWRA